MCVFKNINLGYFNIQGEFSALKNITLYERPKLGNAP